MRYIALSSANMQVECRMPGVIRALQIIKKSASGALKARRGNKHLWGILGQLPPIGVANVHKTRGF
jgi:hypothetical protein